MSLSSRVRRAGLAVLSVGAAALVLAPLPAAADAVSHVDAITDVSVSVDQVVDGRQLTVTAPWELPAGTTPGSHFGLALPAALIAAPVAPFALRDAAGEEVGTCTVEKTGIDCTTNDYLLSHSDVKGSLWFKVTAHYVDGSTSVEIVEPGGATHTVDLTVTPKPQQQPNGGSHGYAPAAVVTKRSTNVDRTRARMKWEITVPTTARANGAIVVHDTWTARRAGDGALTLAGRPSVQCKATGSGATSSIPASAISVANHASGMALTITDSSCTGTYVVAYATDLPDSVSGTATYDNEATVAGFATATAHATWTAPATLSKSVRGDNAHRNAAWTVTIGAADLGTGTGRIVDTYSDRLTLDESSVALACKVRGTNRPLSTSSWSAHIDTQAHRLEVAITDEDCRTAGGQYFLTYTTAYPHDAFSGEVYDNTVTAASVTATRSVTYTASAGGSASGTALWSLRVTKHVTGTGHDLVAATPFDVAWSYTTGTADRSGTLHVSDGTSATIPGIPAGAVVTLTEGSAAVNHVDFGAPQYSGAGVSTAGERSATVTGRTGTVAVALTNPAEARPVATPTATPHQVPQLTPAATPQPTPILAPRLEPYPVPTATPHQVPQLTPTATPQPTPILAPRLEPYPVPTATPHQVPQLTPTATPQPTPVLKPTVRIVTPPTTVTTVTSTPRTPAGATTHRPEVTRTVTTGTTTPGRPHGRLSSNGAEPLPWLFAATACVGVGGLLLAARRRR